MKKLMHILFSLTLMLVIIGPHSTASAALPANMSWVRYSGNPVAPSGLCGQSQPTRPSVVVESANNYKMYFTTHPGTAGAKIYLATTTDGGQSWTCANSGNPVLTLGGVGSWDETRVITPSVIKEGDSDYKMWYTGRSSAGVYAIGYATSSDGVSWTKYGSNPVFTRSSNPADWDSSIVREPSVVKVGSTYHMWYSGTSYWPWFKIGHATSSDGISWTRDSANPVLSPTSGAWDANETFAPSVVYDGSSFEMFYSGNNAGEWLTGHATSSDGTTWTKDANAFLAPTGGTNWDRGDSTDYVAAILDSSTWKVFYSGAGTSGYQIGLITLTNQAQLTFRQLSSIVGVGGTVDVYIDLTAVTDLYGYQFEVNYDSSKLSATAAFVNSFFDTTSNASIPPNWNAVCAAGVCKFAVTKLNPAAPISGSGSLARITFTGLAAGEVRLTFSSDILSDRDANPITHTANVGWVTVYGSATVSGVVQLQGRATPIDSGTVTLREEYGYWPPVVVNFSAIDGSWSATVPVMSGGSGYILDAAHGLYLTNRSAVQTFSPGGSYNMPTTRLKGGDADNNGTISLTDLTCIGGDFGGTPGTCGGTGSSDINLDGIVNILDLVLPGGNYGLSTPQNW